MIFPAYYTRKRRGCIL